MAVSGRLHADVVNAGAALNLDCVSIDADLGCVIEGNIQPVAGEKIRHMPRGGSYAATVISPAYGERWFCTEQEAVANGWRKARN